MKITITAILLLFFFSLSAFADQATSPSFKYYSTIGGKFSKITIDGKSVTSTHPVLSQALFTNGRSIFLYAAGNMLISLSGSKDSNPGKEHYILYIDSVKITPIATGKLSEYKAKGKCEVKGDMFKNATISCHASGKKSVSFTFKANSDTELDYGLGYEPFNPPAVVWQGVKDFDRTYPQKGYAGVRSWVDVCYKVAVTKGLVSTAMRCAATDYTATILSEANRDRNKKMYNPYFTRDKAAKRFRDILMKLTKKKPAKGINKLVSETYTTTKIEFEKLLKQKQSAKQQK